MTFRARLLGLACIWLLAENEPIYGQPSYTDYVNVFMGTSGDHGQVSPAATVPFGMVAVGPDSSPRQHAGYDYAETKTSGISINRLSGVGCSGCGGNLSIRPTDYEQVLRRMPETENASPGYYSVAFDEGTTVSLTATERMAVEKYRFARKEDKEQALYVDFFSSFSGATAQYRQVSEQEIQGVIRGGNTCGVGAYQLSFCLYTNLPFTYTSLEKGKGKLSFGEVDSVEIRIGLSSVSPAEASCEVKQSLEKDFTQIREAASLQWEGLLSRIEVEGGTEEERILFYTSLYRTALSPHEVARPGEFYRGTDGNLHLSDNRTFYSSWSIWDTFRAKFTLLNLLAPERMPDIAHSLLLLYRYGKEAWSTSFEPTPSVRTEHTATVLLDCYRRGVKEIDFSIAYKAMKKEVEALQPKSPDSKIEAVGDFWALSQIAGIIGQTEDEEKYKKQAEELFEQVWKKEFMNITPEYAKMGGNGMYQGTAWQYRWAAPFYLDKMKEWVGEKELVQQLTYFFDHSLYNQGNEPDIHVPYIFNKLERPDLTRNIVHRLLTDDQMIHLYGGNAEFKTPYIGRAFRNLPEGYIPEMDEDDGTMSAWYAFSAMGLFPLVVGSDEYELVAPLFDKVVLHLPSDKSLEIVMKGRKNRKKDAKKVLLNGMELKDFCLRHAELEKGGMLTFVF